MIGTSPLWIHLCLRNHGVDDSVIATSNRAYRSYSTQQSIRSDFSDIDCHEKGNHFFDP